jgi:hypothetical protein
MLSNQLQKVSVQFRKNALGQKPVEVQLLPNMVKRPDLTGLLNTNEFTNTVAVMHSSPRKQSF